MIFVDTSVLIDLLRGKATPATQFLANLEADDVPYAIPLLCCQEVLQGARDQNEWRLLHENLSAQRLALPADPTALHWEAARIFFDCRKRGLHVRSGVDCLIAAQVMEAKATLLHDDKDFERIKKVRKGLRTERGIARRNALASLEQQKGGQLSDANATELSLAAKAWARKGQTTTSSSTPLRPAARR